MAIAEGQGAGAVEDGEPAIEPAQDLEDEDVRLATEGELAVGAEGEATGVLERHLADDREPGDERAVAGVGVAQVETPVVDPELGVGGTRRPASGCRGRMRVTG